MIEHYVEHYQVPKVEPEALRRVLQRAREAAEPLAEMVRRDIEALPVELRGILPKLWLQSALEELRRASEEHDIDKTFNSLPR